MNKVILVGNLARDPELRQTPNGIPTARFTVAVSRRYQRDGQTQADFISCVAWRNTAEFVAKYFAKGRMMGVVGSLQTGRYEKDGQTHYTTDVLVDEAYFADSKSSSDASTSAPIQNTTADFGADAGLMPIPADDDLPF